MTRARQADPAGEGVVVPAPAKINLTLRVLERRPSGFHDLETLFQAVDLCDELTVRLRSAPGVALTVTGADVGPVSDNLVTRAAEAFLEAAGIDSGLEVRLDKRIPAGAGLGGGSSDAGATLRALAALHPGPTERVDLFGLAAALGSDVPFFAGEAGLALGRGRGERLTPLPSLSEADVVLALPAIHVATGAAYAALARRREAGGGAVPPALFGEGEDPESAAPDWPTVAAGAVNDFEPVVAEKHPEVSEALRALRSTHPLMCLLSGSGAAVFAVYETGTDAARAREAAASACPGTDFVATRTLGRLPGTKAPGLKVPGDRS